MDRLYTVIFEDFTQRHFIKSFRKKYSEKNWKETEIDIVSMCERIDNFRIAGRVAIIKENDNYSICKLEFKVVGTKDSPRASGNRCILLEDKVNRVVRVLLVYSKNDFKGSNETEWWKQEVSSAILGLAEKFGQKL